MAQTSILAGGSPGPNLGVTPPPESASLNNSTYSALAEGGGQTLLGMSVLADLPSDTLQFTRSLATGATLARCLGLVIKSTPSGTFAPATVKEQGAGIVKLTTAEWDAVTGDSGGLEISAVYYVSDVSAGHISRTKPVTSGHYVTQIGYGLSATEMQLQVMAPVLIP